MQIFDGGQQRGQDDLIGQIGVGPRQCRGFIGGLAIGFRKLVASSLIDAG